MNKTVSTNTSSKSKKRMVIFTIIVLCVDLFFLYMNKYNRKNLSILEFNLYTFGNMLNFISFIIPIIGVFILYFKNKTVDLKYYYIITTLAICLTLPLVVTVIIKEMKITISLSYLWGYPVEKIFIALLFSFCQYLLIMLGIFSWLLIFNSYRKLFIRLLLYSLFVIFLLVVVAFFYKNQENNSVDFNNSEIHSDVAVILGAAVWSKTKPSPIFASRIYKANNLYSAGIAKKIQVTGGKAPGEQSEAKVAFNLLVKCGVNPDDIWLEEKSSSTSEQIAFIKERLVEEKRLKNILIVSDEFHLKRAIEICKFYNVQAEGVASDLKLSQEKSLVYRFRDSIALLIFWLFAI